MVSLTNNDGIGVYYPGVEGDASVAFAEPSYTFTETTDVSDPVIGCRSASTQKILNNLPDWMAMRAIHTSNGQVFVHSYACNLEDSSELIREYRADTFLASANQYQDVHTGISELSFEEDKVYEPTFRNLMFNSSFSLTGPSRYGKPDGWAVSRDLLSAVSFDTQNSLFGTHGIILDGTKAAAQIKQNRKLSPSAGSINASVYVKTDDNGGSSTEIYATSVAGLVIEITYADFSTEAFGVGFPNNSEGKWRRASFSTKITKEMHKVELFVVNGSAVKMYFDLPQLELSTVATGWTHNVSDVPTHSEATTRTVNGIQVLLNTQDNIATRKIELFPTESEDEFRFVSVPTRVELFTPSDNPNNAFAQKLGRQINAFGEIMPVTWVATNDSITEKSLISHDKFGTVLPADLILDDSGDKKIDKSSITGGTTVAKATAVVGQWLYVLTKETYAGSTGYFLKITKPKKVLYEDNFIQSYGDLPIDIPLGNSFGIGSMTEDIIRMGPCSDIPNAIYIDTNADRRFYLKLKFDYFYADFGARKLFCRENYMNQNGLLQVV